MKIFVVTGLLIWNEIKKKKKKPLNRIKWKIRLRIVDTRKCAIPGLPAVYLFLMLIFCVPFPCLIKCLFPVCLFLSVDAMDMPFLNPYLDSIGLPNFRKGCNFAAAGSTILPATGSSAFPFSFGIQVAQFVRFKARVLDLLKSTFILICKSVLLFFLSAKNAFKKVGSTNFFVLCVWVNYAAKKLDKYLPAADYFAKGLYMFDIGQNDLAGAFYSKPLDQVLASIPTILAEFEDGINVSIFARNCSISKTQAQFWILCAILKWHE